VRALPLLLGILLLAASPVEAANVYTESWEGYAAGTNVTSLTPPWVRTNTFEGSQVTVENYAGFGGTKAMFWPNAAYWMTQAYSGATFGYTSLTVKISNGARFIIGFRLQSTAGLTAAYPDGYSYDTLGYLNRYIAGASTVLSSGAPSPIYPLTLVLVANGSSLAVYENGSSTPFLTATDSTYSSGYIALQSFFGGNAYVGPITVDNDVFATNTPTFTPSHTPTATPTPTVTPTQVPCGDVLSISQFGDSFQQGNGCAATEAGALTGLRPYLIDTLQTRYGRPSTMVSPFGSAGGRLACNKTNAVSGETTTQILTRVQDYEALNHPVSSRNNVCMLGGGTAGWILGERSIDYQATQKNACMDVIYANDPQTLIVLINPLYNPTTDTVITDGAYRASLAYAQSKGYRVVGYDPNLTLPNTGTLGNPWICSDDLHPNNSAQVVMGQEIAALIHQAMLTGNQGSLRLSKRLRRYLR